MATHSSILAWKIPRTEEPRGLVHSVAKGWRQLSVHARAHKKAFLSDQCKEIEENNTMGKTRDS